MYERSLRCLGGVVMALSLLSACSLPTVVHDDSASKAIAPEVSAQTKLGQAYTHLSRQAQADAAHSGIYPLNDPREAFAARGLLAREAEHTLDVQYYIWRNDKTGLLLLHELLMAADRGVRVRLLLDDGGTAGLDQELRSLHSHPNVQVRLFNPFVQRGWLKSLGYITEFSRTNRRMHNKSFSADGQSSIVGGRNVGNEYFGATDGVLFADLDVLVIGPVVQDIEQDFDRYWNNVAAYPVDQVVHAEPLPLDNLRNSGLALMQAPASQDYQKALQSTFFVQNLLRAQLPMEWASATLVSDPPEKIQGASQKTQQIGAQLLRAIGTPHTSLDLVSPYFVPTQAGVDAFAHMRAQGLRVRILTNALEATDVAIVHSGYAKYRKPLLEQGVELYEMRGQAPDYADEKLRLQLKALGSSGSSLHAKTFAVDGKRAFVGSFNFDPRSVHLNTEMGLMIESPALAQQISHSFDRYIPSSAYRVTLSPQGKLRWHSGIGDPPPVYDQEPQTTWYQRWTLWLLGKLPIEWLL
ncbi:phospholipase D family protein [Comamonas sp. NoAH]|uniref:phospholipase D family protein n=1 Tax=Comamonas halotolerans TaxID=3041496 RepID=UPI0024E04717|nr:phospholipase D family protein [Comamonas sp. NoAH]